MKRLAIFGILAFSVVFLWVGCSKNDDDSDNTTDEQALVQMMTDDSDVEGLDTWSNGDNGLGGGTLDDPITPLRWGRHGTWRRVSVTVDFSGDTLATITRTASFNGFLRVVTDTTDSVQHLDKPMTNMLERKAHAVRVARTRHPRMNWRIKEITPEVLFDPVDSNPHPIFPTSISMYIGSMGALQLIAQVTDPLNTYFSRDSLPTIPANAQVTVHVQANRATDALAFLHPRVFRRLQHPRLPMADDGIFPDETAGDGNFAASFLVGDRVGVFGVGADLIDRNTLYDSAALYNSGGWAIPYRVINSPTN